MTQVADGQYLAVAMAVGGLNGRSADLTDAVSVMAGPDGVALRDRADRIDAMVGELAVFVEGALQRRCDAETQQQARPARPERRFW